MQDRVQGHLPLKPLVLEILLSLAAGANHGYAVMQGIEERTGGTVPARPGAFYRVLARALDADFVAELAEPPAGFEGSDPRRRYYILTPLGREVARAELERLEDAAVLGRARGLL